MIFDWNSLNNKAKKEYLDFYTHKHAEWNNISEKKARRKLISAIRQLKPTFSAPIISYEFTR